jgi:hypothetical protein
MMALKELLEKETLAQARRTAIKEVISRFVLFLASLLSHLLERFLSARPTSVLQPSEPGETWLAASHPLTTACVGSGSASTYRASLGTRFLRWRFSFL